MMVFLVAIEFIPETDFGVASGFLGAILFYPATVATVFADMVFVLFVGSYDLF